MEDSFGYWLVGFIDGEGSFNIISARQSYWLSFSLKLRDDDAAILHTIHEVTQLGHLLPVPAHRTSNPQLGWSITSKADCLGLIAILDRYPLRTRKAKDYAYWREAAMWWVQQRQGCKRDWSPMATLRHEMQANRAYVFEQEGNSVRC